VTSDLREGKLRERKEGKEGRREGRKEEKLGKRGN
jgi:hypothetical protein